MTHAAHAFVDVDQLLRAARELSTAGRWERAALLLDAVTADDPADRARLVRARAEVALDRDWFAGTDTAAARIEAAEREFPDGDWDTGFLRLRHTYARLLHVAGTLHIGPTGKDPEALAALRDRARDLYDAAPDEVRRGWAAHYRGLIADNHFADRTAAAGHYARALHAGEDGTDDLLAREALRHLGDQDHDSGDHERAQERWRRATALGARAGAVRGTLSQQLLLAVLARDTGDEAGAAALATEIVRWAEAIGADRLRAGAAAFLAGADPTAPGPAGTDTPTPVLTRTDTPTPSPAATTTPTPSPAATNTPTPEPTAPDPAASAPAAPDTATPNPASQDAAPSAPAVPARAAAAPATQDLPAPPLEAPLPTGPTPKAPARPTGPAAKASVPDAQA
ncbi:hypothetical protein ACWC0C_31800 [Streptomyces sp. NPDC001709]